MSIGYACLCVCMIALPNGLGQPDVVVHERWPTKGAATRSGPRIQRSRGPTRRRGARARRKRKGGMVDTAAKTG